MEHSAIERIAGESAAGKVRWGAQGDRHADLHQVKPETVIAIPFNWLPNPSETTCLRVEGASMAPLLNDGDIIAVDNAQNDPASSEGGS